jgi:anti-anti-sigma factor
VATRDEFDVRVETMPGGSVVVRVSGDLDLATTPGLEEALATAGDAPRLVLDLSECTFLDSSGVRVLTTSARTASERGASFDLVAADPGVLRVLEITGVDTMATVHPSLDAAL